ncbi:MAG: acyl-CoA thioesterase [Planctomycetes bacterium]|nr:acyl-CoA thioesterase [Planctomycetota bacterium]
MNAPQVPDSSRLRFRRRVATRWSDEDNQNVLNNAIYLTLFEEARLGWARQLGLLEGNHFPFLLAQTNVRFVAPGKGGVEVDVELGTTRLGKSSFEQAYRVRDAATGTVWAEGEALLVCYDQATGKSRPMTAQFRGAIEAFESPFSLSLAGPN